jgi:two-component sensor histidine kinase
MALMHEKTYQSDSLDGANVKNYVESQSREIINLYGANNIELLCDIDDVELSMDIIIPLGLMINELILNTIKYAFPEGGGHLWISLKIVGYGMVLTVCDDGVGLPDDFDVHTSNSLGMTILQTLSKQIDGEFVNLNPERGTSIQISFPIK